MNNDDARASPHRCALQRARAEIARKGVKRAPRATLAGERPAGRRTSGKQTPLAELANGERGTPLVAALGGRELRVASSESLVASR